MAIVSRMDAVVDTEAELADLSVVAGQKAVCLDTGNRFICDGATWIMQNPISVADKAKLDGVSDGATAPDEVQAVLAAQVFSR